MENHLYHLFRTRWGWFGILGIGGEPIRTCLPVPHKEAVLSRILLGMPDAKRSKKAFSALENRIKGYYEGRRSDFGDVPIRLDGCSEFQRKVLTTLRAVRFGQTVSYRQLAELAGNSKAARAIGAVMAQNPLPLILPCHRVIKADGSPGLFTAPGGPAAKIRMLELEKQR